MATRTGRLSKPDKQGKYARQLGWKINDSGNKVQHKFRLGTNKREAERRDSELRQIWEAIESETKKANESRNRQAAVVVGGRFDAKAEPTGSQLAQEPLWDEDSLGIAKQVAQGDSVVVIPLEGESEGPTRCGYKGFRTDLPFCEWLRVIRRSLSGKGEKAV